MKIARALGAALSLSSMLFVGSASADAAAPVGQVGAVGQLAEGGQVVAVGCTSVVVGAAPSDAGCVQAPAVVPEPTTRRVWYGWQTLATDGAALVLISASSSMRDSGDMSSLAVASLVTYVVGGPIVHVANGSPAKMGMSLGLRLGAPLLLGAAGYYAFGGDSSHDWGAAIGAALGGFFGIAGAVAVDSAVLARKTVNVEPHATGARITPTVVPTRGGAALGAVGTF